MATLPISNRMKNITGIVLVMLAFTSLLGCRRSGEVLVPISGKVTFAGKPLATGSVRFYNPQTGIDMLALIGSDGTYKVLRAKGPGLPEGTYQIAILPPQAEYPIGGLMEAPPKQEPFPDVPAKYRDPATSGLTVTVEPGQGVVTLNLDVPKK